MINKMECWECGKEIEVEVEEYYNPSNLKVYDKEWNARKNLHKREYCTECKKEVSETKKEEIREYTILKSKLMIQRAIKLMEIQNIDVYEYQEAIEAVSETFLEDMTKFRSSEEIVATIILVQSGFKLKTNYKIGRYTADIYIPSLTCIVEIDGYMHRNEEVKLKDGNKDIYIRNLLGSEWEIIRIPTKFIDEKAEEIVSAIIELKSKMMELRETNRGFLPYGYSETQNAVYNKILKKK